MSQHHSLSGQACNNSDRSVVWGAATNWLAFAATLAVSFFLAPYLLRQLGAARYGVWCVVEAVLAYFTLLDLGIAACLVRYAARCYARCEMAELNRYTASAFWLYSGAASLVLVLGVPVMLMLAPALQRRLPEANDRVAPFLLLMLLQFASTLPLSVFPTLLDGLQLFGRKSAVRLAALAGRVAGIVAVMEVSPGLLGLGVVLAASQWAEHGLMLLLARHQLPGLSVGWQWVDRRAVREVLSYSRDAFVAMVAGRIGGQSGPIVAGLLLSAASAAHYALAYRLVDMGKNLLRAATTTLTPAVSQREARGDQAGLRRLFLEASRAVLYLSLPLHLGLLWFGRPFLQRWLGSEAVAEVCYPAAVLLSLTLTPGVAQSVAARVLYGVGQLRWFSRLSLLEAVAGLLFGLVLTSRWGLHGLALAVAMPHLLFCLWTIAAACRYTGLSSLDYWRHSCRRPLLAALVPLAIWWGIGPVPADWRHLIQATLLGLAPYGVLVLACEGQLRWLGEHGLRMVVQRRRLRGTPS